MAKNKTGKYLKYAIGEIVLVMIGILLAVQVNNWNTYQNERDNVYKKMVVSQDGKTLLGAVLVGDTSEYDSLLQYALNGIELPENPDALILPSNGGEKPQLSKPGDIVETVRKYIRVDRVSYSDGSHPVGEDPWPVDADGIGKSLTRKVSTNYGNDVDNWQASTPTPGY